MNGAALRVLLVEDNAGDARLLRELFKDAYGIEPQLTHVTRLEDALQVLETRSGPPPDVVLLDLSLPDASGLNTLARMKGAASGVPVVVLTGLDDEELALAAMQTGAQDYLVKGRLDGSLLARAIRYAVERHRAEEAGRRLLREQAARAEAEAAERRSRYLAEAGSLLVSEEQTTAALGEVARLTVGLLGGGCRIELLEQNAYVPAAVCHCEPSQQEMLRDGPVLVEASLPNTLQERLRSGEAVVLTSGVLSLAYPGGGAGLVSALLVAPVIARGRSLGRMLITREDVPVVGARNKLGFASEEVAIIQACASRVALAVDNARLLAARNEILAVVSHDMRNPLMLINTAVAMLGRSEVTSQQREKWLGTMKRASSQMTRLIRDLLDVTSIDAGHLSLDRTPCEVETLLSEAQEMLRPLVEEKELRLEVSKPGDAPALVIDHDRLLQVLGNLVGNAVKFTPAGGLVTIAASLKGEAVCFTVRDSGSGIAPELLPHIFDRYWQARRGGREGVGLGLAIARGIVHAHGGELWAESEPGQGSAFHFTVPLAPAAAIAL